MSGISIIVDTNIVVYLLNGNERVAELLNGNEIYLSFITELELFGKKDLTPSEKEKFSHSLSNVLLLISLHQ